MSKKAVDSTSRLRPVALETWLESTRRLLSLEQKEEVETMRDEVATLDDRDNPNVLLHLSLSRSYTGLFGRPVFQFTFPSLFLHKPKPHHFTVGDVVQVRSLKPKSSQKE
ncbi:unnamed protein product [Peronospora destructor]|uniref:Helicase SMUBP-2/HCS1 1B domain-containing protein n=1 Tax=Peronospora destructor TaxID=86335 RepID=A0AAV0UGB4_9STRA|nr:unnamed protein product [Peronospora destructor]